MHAISPKQRPATAFLMASLLSSYPDARCIQGVCALFEDAHLDLSCAVTDPEVWPGLRRHVEAALASQNALNALRSEYIAIFDRGRQHNSLYETECGRNALVKGNTLADIAGFYRAFGLEFGHEDSTHDMLDHVSVELEFYALLIMKQEALAASRTTEGEAIVYEARQKFLEAHLGRFVGAIASSPGVAASAFYGPLLAWCRDLVVAECAWLDIVPIPVEGLRTWANPEEIGCGSMCSMLGGHGQPVQAR